MVTYARKFLCLLLILGTALLTPNVLPAAEHVVTPLDLQKAVDRATEQRQSNVNKVQLLLGSAPAMQAMEDMNVDASKIIEAVPTLTDEELAKIAAQVDVAQSDFAAGQSNRDLIYLLIVVLLVVAIVVILVQAVD